MEGSVASRGTSDAQGTIGVPEDIEFGSEYGDTVTGFIGKCTAVCVRMHEDLQILLENEHEGRWLPASRVDDASNVTSSSSSDS